MDRSGRGSASPAIVIAIAALVAAVGGTAVASDPLASTARLKKKDKRQVKKIASKQIAKQFPVETSQIADGAVTDAKVAEGTLTGLAKAWGEITPGGGVRQAYRLNGTHVSRPSGVPGRYCISFPASNLTATAGLVPGEGVADITVYTRESLTDQGASPATFGCSASTTWVALTHQSAVAKNAYFQIVLH